MNLPAELVDAITEVVARPYNAARRAAVIHKIIEEIIEAVVWRHGSQPRVQEIGSLSALLASADDHVDRMMLADGASPTIADLDIRSDR